MDNKNSTTKLTNEEMTQVKGGPAYLKLGDIKGEARATTRGGGAGKVSLQDFHF